MKRSLYSLWAMALCLIPVAGKAADFGLGFGFGSYLGLASPSITLPVRFESFVLETGFTWRESMRRRTETTDPDTSTRRRDFSTKNLSLALYRYAPVEKALSSFYGFQIGTSQRKSVSAGSSYSRQDNSFGPVVGVAIGLEYPVNEYLHLSIGVGMNYTRYEVRERDYNSGAIPEVRKSKYDEEFISTSSRLLLTTYF